jgi:dipeptidyl aminopeptidase/acylaminoacyl peptidase
MSRIVKLVLVVTLVSGQIDAFASRPITVEDCVRTRRIVYSEVRISPDGSQVAYVVKAPNLATNHNDYQLYVRDLHATDSRQNGRMVLQADRISGIRWLDSERIMALTESGSSNEKVGDSRLSIINVATGTVEALELPGKIQEYSASAGAGGDRIVFSVKAPTDDSAWARETEKLRDERGYSVTFGDGTLDSPQGRPEDEVFLATKSEAGKLNLRRLDFSPSEDAASKPFLRDVSGLDLSPDGKYLLMRYSSDSLPTEWEGEPYFAYLKARGTPFYTYVLGLYEMDTGLLGLAFNFPGGFLETKWSNDSRSYAVVGPSPFGTSESRVVTAGSSGTLDMSRYILQFEHVFAVRGISHLAAKVVDRRDVNLQGDLPLYWEHGRGPMLVRTDAHTLAWMELEDTEWKKTASLSLPDKDAFFSSLDSDGKTVIGVYETTLVPPELFRLDLKTEKWALLTDLNPEYREIELGPVEPIAWANRYGSKCAGFLIKPVGYRPGKRYPMILLSAPPRELFISDSAYTTAYAPQSLATAGFVVVISQYPLDNRVPRGRFPGEMSAAYNWMAMVESAVDLVARRGMVDSQNIGIAGFSRTSWLTDFTLTHSTYRFIAASSADSGIYTYGAYFRYNSQSEITSSETQVGGPPYGRTLKDWLRYAPPFNVDRVRTAVLMEYTHSADHGLEFFTALSRMGKAVEFYRYPNGSHPLDTPFERVASLQRNVDWFRFWMQGYEGRAPDYDPGQYDRWRALRLRDAADHEPRRLPAR